MTELRLYTAGSWGDQERLCRQPGRRLEHPHTETDRGQIGNTGQGETSGGKYREVMEGGFDSFTPTKLGLSEEEEEISNHAIIASIPGFWVVTYLLREVRGPCLPSGEKKKHASSFPMDF